MLSFIIYLFLQLPQAMEPIRPTQVFALLPFSGRAWGWVLQEFLWELEWAKANWLAFSMPQNSTAEVAVTAAGTFFENFGMF